MSNHYHLPIRAGPQSLSLARWLWWQLQLNIGDGNLFRPCHFLIRFGAACGMYSFRAWRCLRVRFRVRKIGNYKLTEITQEIS